jgi:hypothetical protein
MSYEELLTPEVLELILPTLGFSILLNFILLGALLFGSIRQWIVVQLHTYWIGLQMTRRKNK